MGIGHFQNWRSRGYLPHLDAVGQQQHIVFSLSDAVNGALFTGGPADHRRQLEAYLDRGHGECLLTRPDLAKIVQDELLRLDGARYRLMAWYIMPNHVHVVLEQVGDIAGTVRRWKSWTSREINKALGRSGALWRREYFDRVARDEKHLQTMIDYVESNPVAAGLVAYAVDWPWSSAAHRASAGQGPGGH
jgi:putative transposase